MIIYSNDGTREDAQLVKTALRSMVDILFGCYHHHFSRVFTIRSRTYQVCVKCGREFEYSWPLMQRKRRAVAGRAYATLSTVSRVGASAI